MLSVSANTIILHMCLHCSPLS